MEPDIKMDDMMMRRGSPKKRFLWRRTMLPLLDTSTDITNDKPKEQLQEQHEKIQDRSRQEKKKEKKFVDKEFQVVVKDQSPATVSSTKKLPRDMDSSHLFTSSNSNSRRPPGQPPPVQKTVSLEDSQSEGDEETHPSEEPLVTSNSEDSDEHCNGTTSKRDQAADNRKGSHLVVTTAASVLLLMRYSVTEEALNRLSSGKPPKISAALKDNHQSNPTNKEETKGEPLLPNVDSSTPLSTVKQGNDEPLETQSTPYSAPTTPTTIRRVSMPLLIEPECPNRLAMPEDPNELNSLHCFVRAHLLEVFSLPSQRDKPGRVGLRCVFCAHLPRKDRAGTTMCTFYPKSLQDLYRSVMTWQRLHFRVCKHVTTKVKDEYWKHKESDQTRGKTTYWVTSAMRLGLQDINHGRNGIFYHNPTADRPSNNNNLCSSSSQQI